MIPKRPPYFFMCRNCLHKFERNIPVGLICPVCRSLRIVSRPVMK